MPTFNYIRKLQYTLAFALFALIAFTLGCLLRLALNVRNEFRREAAKQLQQQQGQLNKVSPVSPEPVKSATASLPIARPWVISLNASDTVCSF